MCKFFNKWRLSPEGRNRPVDTAEVIWPPLTASARTQLHPHKMGKKEPSWSPFIATGARTSLRPTQVAGAGTPCAEPTRRRQPRPAHLCGTHTKNRDTDHRLVVPHILFGRTHEEERRLPWWPQRDHQKSFVTGAGQMYAAVPRNLGVGTRSKDPPPLYVARRAKCIGSPDAKVPADPVRRTTLRRFAEDRARRACAQEIRTGAVSPRLSR